MSINTNQYRSQHIQDKAKDWVQEVNKSVKVVKSEPNCAIVAFTQGPRNCYTYLIRTIPVSKINPIQKKLIPELLGRQQCNNDERKLLDLPPKFGSLGIINPVDIAKTEYTNSKKLIETLTKAIKCQ